MIWVGLFRGLNVGKTNRIKNDELINALASINLSNITTYIQSGNVVFETNADQIGSNEPEQTAEELEAQIDEVLQSQLAIEAKVKVFSKEAFLEIIEANPYMDLDDIKHIHISILFEPAVSPQVEKIEADLASGEQYTLTPDAFYFYAPNGVGRSKCFNYHEKRLGVAITSRNLRTFIALRKMLDA